MVAVAVISIGIPSVQVKKVDTNSYVEPEPISEIKQKKRKPISEIVHKERFGQPFSKY